MHNVFAALDGLLVLREFPAHHAQGTPPVDQNVVTADYAAAETDSQALARLAEHAALHHDGHFTLLKFTTNWRCMLGTISPKGTAIQRMPCGHTLSDAVSRAIRHAQKHAQ